MKKTLLSAFLVVFGQFSASAALAQACDVPATTMNFAQIAYDEGKQQLQLMVWKL
ncbi:MAG: hypothetical protein V4574_02380 [Pseudomonadota bacterium]